MFLGHCLYRTGLRALPFGDVLSVGMSFILAEKCDRPRILHSRNSNSRRLVRRNLDRIRPLPRSGPQPSQQENLLISPSTSPPKDRPTFSSAGRSYKKILLTENFSCPVHDRFDFPEKYRVFRSLPVQLSIVASRPLL